LEGGKIMFVVNERLRTEKEYTFGKKDSDCITLLADLVSVLADGATDHYWRIRGTTGGLYALVTGGFYSLLAEY
jgi:hypothetical protein